ncbi:MAG: hypothetical protein ACW99R_17965 [Candidatus Hodarchaeales archaeon]|jgi:hypothetical protein
MLKKLFEPPKPRTEPHLSELLEQYIQLDPNYVKIEDLGKESVIVGNDIITFTEPIPSEIKQQKRENINIRALTLIQQIEDDRERRLESQAQEMALDMFTKVRPSNVLERNVRTPHDVEFAEQFVSETKRLDISFETNKRDLEYLSYEPIYDDPINSISPEVLKTLKYVGLFEDPKSNKRFEMYTPMDYNWSKGNKLVESFIMANYDKLWRVIRNMGGQAYNRAISLNVPDEMIEVAGWYYPRDVITKYIDGCQADHIICKQVQAKNGQNTLFIPYGDVTLAVRGIRKHDTPFSVSSYDTPTVFNNLDFI